MRDDLSKMYGTENKVAKQKKTGDPNGKMRFLKNQFSVFMKGGLH